jgi:hypothetical protein
MDNEICYVLPLHANIMADALQSHILKNFLQVWLVPRAVRPLLRLTTYMRQAALRQKPSKQAILDGTKFHISLPKNSTA